MTEREYTIVAPDGRELTIVGPVNATPQQLRAAAEAAFKVAQAPKPQAEPDQVGPLDAFMIGAGRATDKVVRGVRQAYNTAIGDKETLASMAADEAEKDRLYKPLKQQRPMLTSLGEALPSLALPAGGATAAAFIARAGLSGALPGALSYGSLEDRAKAAAVGGAGGAIGGALGLGASRLLKPAGQAAGISDEAAAAADRLGMNLTAGQKTQNPAMVNFENYLAKSPGSSGAMQRATDANQRAMNRAAASSIGQSADDLGEGVFREAKRAIGSEFERLQQITQPQLGDDFLGALAKIDADNVARGSFRSKSVDSLVDKGIDLAAQNKLTGKAYKEIRTQLTNEAESAFRSGDATLGQAIKTVRKALDDAAKSSLSKADQEAWDTTRAQWMAYKQLTRANVAEGGNVSAARLASGLRRGGDTFRTGEMSGPLADIARVGEAVKGAGNPNSGQLAQQMLYGNPLTGIPMMVGNKAAQAVYMNPLTQRYLSGGLLDLGDAGRTVIGNAGIVPGLPTVQSLLGAQ